MVHKCKARWRKIEIENGYVALAKGKTSTSRTTGTSLHRSLKVSSIQTGRLDGGYQGAGDQDSDKTVFRGLFFMGARSVPQPLTSEVDAPPHLGVVGLC